MVVAERCRRISNVPGPAWGVFSQIKKMTACCLIAVLRWTRCRLHSKMAPISGAPLSKAIETECTLAAVLAADVAGFSRLVDVDETGTLRALPAQRAASDAAIGRIDGPPHRGSSRMTTIRHFAAFLAANVIGYSCVRAVLFRALMVSASMASSFHAHAQSDTVINITWVEVMDRTSPAPQNDIRVTTNLTIQLGADRQITESLDRKSGKFETTAGAVQTLGKEWRVADDNSLVREHNFPTHIRRLTVSVSGRQCRLAVTHERKEGATDYATNMLSRPGVTGRYSRIQTVSTACTIR